MKVKMTMSGPGAESGRTGLGNLWSNSHEDCFLGFTGLDKFSFSLFKFSLEGEGNSHTRREGDWHPRQPWDRRSGCLAAVDQGMGRRALWSESKAMGKNHIHTSSSRYIAYRRWISGVLCLRASRESSKANSKELKWEVQTRFVYTVLPFIREEKQRARIEGKKRDRFLKINEMIREAQHYTNRQEGPLVLPPPPRATAALAGK